MPDFVGAGWAFPLRVDPAGRIALVRGRIELEEAMRIILGTAKGERPMRPEFGCGIHDHVFDPINPTTIGLVAHDVRVSLDRWEPRVDVIDVDVRPDPHVEATLLIDIHYRERGSNNPRNLVFPFYMIPAEASDEGAPAPAELGPGPAFALPSTTAMLVAGSDSLGG